MTRLTLVLPLVLAGCASTPTVRPGSPLERRQMQSRTFSDCDRAAVLRAVLATFQDEGFTVETTDATLGLATATRQTFQPGTGSGLKKARIVAALFTYGATLLIPVKHDQLTELEGTAQVEDVGAGEVRLRVTFQLRVLGKEGRLVAAHEVSDPLTYQSFLAGVDRSLFLHRERL